MANNELPPGFKLDEDAGLPPGFKLDEAVGILGMETKQPDDRTLYQKAAQGATESIGQQGGPLAAILSRGVIPQNEAELGMYAGTLGGAGLASKLGLTGMKGALTRIAGAGVGGEAGGQVGGQPTGAGAVTGVAGGAVGETVAPTLGWLTRSAPGMKGVINRQRSGEIGKVIEQRVPALSGARDPHALDQMARDFEQGKGALLDYYGQLTGNLEAKLGNQKLNIPELQSTGPQHLYGPQGGVTIREVMDELKKAGHYGYGGEKSNPNMRTIVGEEPRMEYGALLQKTKDELDRIDPTGALSKDFTENRGTAAAGFTLLKMLQGGRAFSRYPRDVQLNIPWLQEYVNQNQSEIRRKVGDASFAKLQEILWPGGGKMGTRDIAAVGGGNTSDVLMETARGVGGSPKLATSPLRALLPSLGAQYAGRPPYSPSGGIRTLADLLAQRGLVSFGNPTGGRP